MRPTNTRENGRFKLVGGVLCLDFANTRASRDTDNPIEYLHSYADLVAWAEQVGLVDDGKHLLEVARQRPAEAEAVLTRARVLREAIYSVFSHISAGKPVPSADLDTLNLAVTDALSRARVVARHDGFAWGWAAGPDDLDRVLWPVARSAAELLTSDALSRVRECAGDHCGWLFLDTSRNRSRRWCDMRDCGNRAKVRRHYQRRRAARTSTG